MGIFGSALNVLFQPFLRGDPTFVQSQMMRDAASSEQAHKARIAAAWRAYYGDLPRPLRVKIGQPDDNIMLNFARLVVDKSVSFLYGAGVEFGVEGATVDSDAVQWLSQVWARNRKNITLHRIGINAAVAGHAFVKIAMQDGQKYPRLIVVDPSCVSVVCQPDDYEVVLEYRIDWNAIDPMTKKPVAMRQVIAQEGDYWRIFDQQCTNGKTWLNVREPALWPYTWPPIFSCQNLPSPNDFWGVPDLDDGFLRVLSSRNFLASNIARILRYHAHPKTYAVGMTASSKLELSVDDIACLPNPHASLKNLEMQGDLQGALEMLRYIDDQLLSLACIPPIALGKVDKTGPISGVALRLYYQTMLERNGTKQMLQGEMYNTLNARLLELNGMSARCTTSWADSLPFSPDDALALDQLAVVSKETLASKLGFNYAAELPRIQDEKRTLEALRREAFDRGYVPPPLNVGMGDEDTL